jgi:class 3 adenylate cyclase
MPVATSSGAIVFSDIVGFTEFTARAGDDRALALVERQEELVRELLPPGARIVKQLGDGLLMFFAHVDEALTTTLCLAERYEDESSFDLPLWVRTGLHFGEPRRRGDDLIGHDVNLAARVADLAGPGEVLATADAVGQVPDSGAVRFTELGPVVVKGIPDAVRLFRAEAVSP